MIIGIAVVGIGWIAYGIWWHVTGYLEKKKPKPKSKVKKSFEEYVKKMEKFEKKTYDRDQLQR